MRQIVLLLALSVIKPGLANGQSELPPPIRFDVPSVVGCREVTTEEFARTHSLEKLLEVRLQTSSLLATGTDRCIRELLFIIYSPERSFRIVDFSPQTTLITEYASPIDESRNLENTNSAGLNFTPALEMIGRANLNASLSDREGKSIKISRLPPKQLSIASGTRKRATAVYFKMKPSTQSTLEGSQELSLIIQVPISWRADLLHVHCSGVTAWKPDGQTRKSRSDFTVPIYLSTDAPAKLACDRFTKSEIQLRRAATRFHGRMPSEKKDLASRVSMFVKREVLGKKTKKSSGTDWLGSILFTNEKLSDVFSESGVKIDHSTRKTAEEFRSARQNLVALNE